MPPQLLDFGLIMLAAGAAVFLLAVLLRSYREAFDAIPRGATLDVDDLKETGLDVEVAQILREECGEPAVFEGARGRTGLAILPDGEAAYPTLARIRERLSGRAVPFMSEEAISGGVPACIVTINAKDSLEALTFMATKDGPAIADRLRRWRNSAPLELAGCGEDWVEIWFRKSPADDAIFREAESWSPAAAHECGGVTGMKERVGRDGLLTLWWGDAPESRRITRPGFTPGPSQPSN